MNTCVYIITYSHVYIHLRVGKERYVQTFVCVYTYIYIFIYMYMYIHCKKGRGRSKFHSSHSFEEQDRWAHAKNDRYLPHCAWNPNAILRAEATPVWKHLETMIITGITKTILFGAWPVWGHKIPFVCSHWGVDTLWPRLKYHPCFKWVQTCHFNGLDLALLLYPKLCPLTFNPLSLAYLIPTISCVIEQIP